MVNLSMYLRDFSILVLEIFFPLIPKLRITFFLGFKVFYDLIRYFRKMEKIEFLIVFMFPLMSHSGTGSSRVEAAHFSLVPPLSCIVSVLSRNKLVNNRVCIIFAIKSRKFHSRRTSLWRDLVIYFYLTFSSLFSNSNSPRIKKVSCSITYIPLPNISIQLCTHK